MSRRRVSVALSTLAAAAAAFALTACGAADAPSEPAPSGTPSARGGTAPSPGGLRVGATDLRLGDATTADGRTGVRRLPVPRHRVDPDALDRAAGRRDGVAAGASCRDADVVPGAANLETVAAATLCLVNAERADAGAGALTPNARLATAARGHSLDMVADQYFAHLAEDGRSLVDRITPTGYLRPTSGWSIGENLAWGTGTLSTPRKIVAAWMTSPGHRENMLKPAFREVGLGIVTGNPRSRDGAGATYTAVFGLIGDPGAAPSPVADGPVAKTPKKRAGKAERRRAARKRRKAARMRAARRRTAAANRRPAGDRS